MSDVDALAGSPKAVEELSMEEQLEQMTLRVKQAEQEKAAAQEEKAAAQQEKAAAQQREAVALQEKAAAQQEKAAAQQEKAAAQQEKAAAQQRAEQAEQENAERKRWEQLNEIRKQLCVIDHIATTKSQKEVTESLRSSNTNLDLTLHGDDEEGENEKKCNAFKVPDEVPVPIVVPQKTLEDLKNHISTLKKAVGDAEEVYVHPIMKLVAAQVQAHVNNEKVFLYCENKKKKRDKACAAGCSCWQPFQHHHQGTCSRYPDGMFALACENSTLKAGGAFTLSNHNRSHALLTIEAKMSLFNSKGGFNQKGETSVAQLLQDLAPVWKADLWKTLRARPRYGVITDGVHWRVIKFRFWRDSYESSSVEVKLGSEETFSAAFQRTTTYTLSDENEILLKNELERLILDLRNLILREFQSIEDEDTVNWSALFPTAAVGEFRVLHASGKSIVLGISLDKSSYCIKTVCEKVKENVGRRFDFAESKRVAGLERDILTALASRASALALEEVPFAKLYDTEPCLLDATSIFTEYVGEALSTRCRSPSVDAKNLFESGMKAIEALHKLGYVHGDLHAGNVMWDGQRVRFVDFEGAVAFQSEQGQEVEIASKCDEIKQAPRVRSRVVYEGYKEGVTTWEHLRQWDYASFAVAVGSTIEGCTLKNTDERLFEPANTHRRYVSKLWDLVLPK